jgi:hypothetical protein
MRLPLLSDVVDFAVTRNTPDSATPKIYSPTVIFPLNDIGRDQRIQAITTPLRKTANITPKYAIALR